MAAYDVMMIISQRWFWKIYSKGGKKWKIIPNMTVLNVFDSLQNGALTFEAI